MFSIALIIQDSMKKCIPTSNYEEKPHFVYRKEYQWGIFSLTKGNTELSNFGT